MLSVSGTRKPILTSYSSSLGTPRTRRKMRKRLLTGKTEQPLPLLAASRLLRRRDFQGTALVRSNHDQALARMRYHLKLLQQVHAVGFNRADGSIGDAGLVRSFQNV